MNIETFQYNIFISTDIHFLNELKNDNLKQLLNNSVFTKNNYSIFLEIIKSKFGKIQGEFYIIKDNNIEHCREYFDCEEELISFILMNAKHYILINFILS